MAKSTKKFSLRQLKKQDRMVIRVGRDGNVDKVIFPNPVSVGLDAEGLRSALTVEGGIRINPETPPNTSKTLYNKEGKLYFDGKPIFVADSQGALTYDVDTKSLVLQGTLTSTALSGSLTNLSDGTSYIKAGQRVSILTGSDRSITIAPDLPQSGVKATGAITAVETTK